MSYSKQDLLDRLIAFKNEHNRYPTRQDFRSKKITPSKNVFYRIFGSMENTFKQAELFESGELVLEEKQKTRHTISKKIGFSCPFCGSDIQKPFDYATCKTYIILRFVEHIKKNHANKDYLNGIFDCMASVFGRDHRDVERAIGEAGFLKAYLNRQESKNNKVKIYSPLNGED